MLGVFGCFIDFIEVLLYNSIKADVKIKYTNKSEKQINSFSIRM